MNALEELRECPFCGKKAYYSAWEPGQVTTGWRVACSECPVITMPWRSKEAAADGWNARAYDAEIEELSSRLSEIEPLLSLAIGHIVTGEPVGDDLDRLVVRSELALGMSIKPKGA